jgi:hypothetical protein
MKDFSYLLALGLIVLLFLHMILTPLLRPDRDERSREFLHAYGAYKELENGVASWSR